MPTTAFLRTALLVLALGVPALAQGVGGTYKVTNPDGSPVREGVEIVTVLIPPLLGDIWFGLVYVNGSLVEPESFVMTFGPDGVGHWVNQRGNEGHMDDNGNGTLTSIVETGEHRGAERLLTR